MGLHLVRKYRNRWRMLCYDVVKNSKLKLSDLADLNKDWKTIKYTLKRWTCYRFKDRSIT